MSPQVRDGQPEEMRADDEQTEREAASRAAWEWARGPAESHPDRSRHRIAALTQLAAALAVAALLALLVSPHWAVLPLVVGTLFAAITWLSPERLYPRLLAVLRGIGRAAGWLTTWLLLTPFYYLAITPFGLTRRRGRRDPLARRRLPDTASYWLPRDARSVTPEHYERQF